MNARNLVGLFLALLASLAIAWPPCRAGVMVPGGVAGGTPIGSCGVDFTFDSGADQTLISRACAMAMGLLADGDNDGTPDQAAGSRDFNGGEVKTWCFNNIAVAAIDSAGNNCVTTTTVYVSKSNDSWGSADLLGKPWQDAVDACYRAKTNSVKWPWEQPPPAAPKKVAAPVPDTKQGNNVKSVFEGIRFFSGSNAVDVNMAVYSGSGYSIIPQSAAALLGASPIGTVNLSVADPELLMRLSFGSQNATLQTIFPAVMVDAFDLGIGPLGTSTIVLVANDSNSDFGILGDNLLQIGDPTHAVLYASNDALGDTALYYSEIPEPATWLLASLGWAGVVAISARRRPRRG